MTQPSTPDPKSNAPLLFLRRLSLSVLIAGILIFLTGLYYWIIKAGIPPQDPPLEIQIAYAVNSRIGEILIRLGAVTFFGSAALFLLISGIFRKAKGARG